MAKIIAPNRAYNGISASVPFVNGEGSTDDKHLIAWFRDRGYRVEDDKPAKAEKARGEPKDDRKPDDKPAKAEDGQQAG